MRVANQFNLGHFVHFRGFFHAFSASGVTSRGARHYSAVMVVFAQQKPAVSRGGQQDIV